MEDQQILDLYWRRSEAAISETADKYGGYCHFIAYNILRNGEDSEECVNDTYLRAWEAIPPRRPNNLAVFLGKITRNLSLDRYRHATAEKRGGGELTLALEELAFCVSSLDRDPLDEVALTDLWNRFLGALPVQQRKIFLRRYWYANSIKEIASEYGVSESKGKMSLLRSRKRLKAVLEGEGITV